MSHNQITVNSQTPDRLSSITTSLENLTDVTISSIAANQALVYTGSAWENSNNPITIGTVFVGEGATQAYSNSSASGTASGDVVEFYASSPYNNLSATITSSSSWVSALTLNPGTYRINANVALSFSSAGSVSYQVYQDGTAVGGVGYCAQDNVDCHNPAVALVTVAASTTDVFNVKLTSSGSNINTVANQGNRQAELGYFIVERLS